MQPRHFPPDILIVLSRDLFDPEQTPDPRDILETSVELVMVDGEVPIRRL